MRLRRSWRQAGLMLAVVLAGLPLCARPAAPAVIEDVVTIPLPPAARWPYLVATVLRPEGDGPFPVAVISHGSPAGAAERARMGRYLAPAASREFLRRGFMVLLPMRRGYGDTGGPWAEHYASCAAPDYTRAGEEAALDLLAAIDYLRALPQADVERVLLVGQSAGGFASLAAASQDPPGLRAVLNFAGGRGGNPRTRPGEPCGVEPMARTLAQFAQGIRVPALWHYAENDQFFGPVVVRRWYAAFEQAGAPGRLVMQPPFGRDGHALFSAAAGVRLWAPVVDEFLREAGLAYAAPPSVAW
jgi:dienelactone hydrolase